MTEALQELGTYIEAKRPDCVLGWDVTHGELNIGVTPSNIVGLVEFLKADATCRFSTLVDITAVDYPGRAKRFDVVYHLLSVSLNQRVRVRVFLA